MAERKAKWSDERRAHQADMQWKSHLWRDFKITPEEYDDMFARQGGVCAICREYHRYTPARVGKHTGRFARLHVDHNHDTGKVRGLLCHNCNAGMGHFRDDARLLRGAVAYLEAST